MTDNDSGDTASELPGFPAIDFSTFVLSLSTSAFYQMGLVQGPGGERSEQPDLLLARQTIETIKMIRSKTMGNLEPEESKLLESLLYDLHTHFSKLSK